MANTEKISEIIDKQAFDQLTRLNEELNRSAAAMDAVIARSAELAKSGGFKTFKEYQKATEDQNKALKELDVTEKEHIRIQTEERMKRAEVVKGIKDEITARNAATGSVAAMEAKVKQLRAELKGLGDVQGANKEKATQLKGEINKLTTAIKSNSDKVAADKINVGNYKSAWQGVTGAIMKVAGALGLTIGSMKVFQAVVNSTQVVGDKFQEMVSGMKSGLEFLWRRLATFDFSGFIQGLKDAVSAGREYAKELDRMGDVQRGLSIEEQRIMNLIKEQEIIFRDKSIKNLDIRRAAMEKMQEYEKQFTAVRMKEAKRLLDFEIDKARQESGLSREQIENFVAYYRMYHDQLSKGEELYKLEIKYRQRLLLPPQQAAQVMSAYKKAMSEATEEDLKWMRIAAGYSNVSETRRDKIRDAALELERATGKQLEFNLTLLRTENSLERLEEKEGKAATTTQKATVARVENIEPMEVANDIFESIASRMNEATTSEEQFNLALEGTAMMMATLGYEVSAVEAAIKKLQDAEKERLSMNTKLRTEQSNKFWDLMQKEFKEEAELAELKKKLSEDVFSFVGGIEQQLFDNKITGFQQELDLLNKNKEWQLKAAGDNAEAKERIEEEYARKKAEIDKKIAEQEYKKAVFDRALAIAKITLEIGKAIASVMLLAPWMIPIYAAIGAAQIAAILAAPLPTYAKGRKGGKGEFAVVGEEGQEMIRVPGKGDYLTPDKTTLTYLPAGASVISNSELLDGMRKGLFSDMPVMKEGRQGYDIERMVSDSFRRNTDRLIDTIKGKKEAHIRITREGLWMQAGAGVNWQQYINQNIKY